MSMADESPLSAAPATSDTFEVPVEEVAVAKVQQPVKKVEIAQPLLSPEKVEEKQEVPEPI